MNRPLATLLAAIALLLAIVGAVLVLGDPGPPTGPPPAPGAGEAAGRRERVLARAERRAPGAEDARPAEVVPPLPPVERLPTAPGAGFVIGAVTDQASGDAVPGVRLRLLHPTGEEVASAVTDHRGQYQVEGVPEDLPLVLHASGAGYLSGLCCDVRVRDVEIVRKDVELLRAPRVRLTFVELPTRRAAADVPVRIQLGEREVAAGVSDRDGAVELTVPELGRFLVRSGGGDWAPQPAEELVLVPGGGDAEISGVATRGGGLVIDVVDAAEGAVSGVEVSVHGRGLEPVAGRTDGDGRVELGPFPSRVVLRVAVRSADGARRGEAGALARDGHDVPVQVRLRHTVRLRGRVLDGSSDADRPVAGARVDVVWRHDGSVIAATEVARDGSFAVDDLASTNVDVVVRAPGFVDAQTSWEAFGAEETELRMERAPSGTLLGRVLGPHGSPVKDATVSVVPGGVRTTSGEDGAFELEGVPVDAEQRVLVTAAGMRMTDADAAGGQTVQLAVGDRRRVLITMEPVEAEPDGDGETAIRRVTGRLVRRSGAPVAAARVAWAGLEAVTGDDGRFVLERPPRDRRAARPVLDVTPPAGLLEPLPFRLPGPDAEGTVVLDAIGLRDRPVTLLRLEETPGAMGRSLVVALSLDTTDTLLGRLGEPFHARTAVTYDGTWLHVAPAGAWRQGGHRRAWVGAVTAGVPAVAVARWPARADTFQVASPEWRDAVLRNVTLRIPEEYQGGRLRLTVQSAADAAHYARLGLPTDATLRVDAGALRIDPLPRGVWIAELLSPEAQGLPTLRTLIRDGRASAFRPVR